MGKEHAAIAKPSMTMRRLLLLLMTTVATLDS